MGKSLLLTIFVALCLGTALQGQEWDALAGLDTANLEGKWIVVSVSVDGDSTQAQIGQQPGDVITLSSDVNVGLPTIG